MGLGSSSTTYMGHVWPDSIQSHFESFGELVSKWPVTQKIAGHREKQMKFGTRGISVGYIYGVALTL